MRRVFITVLAICVAGSLFAQDSTTIRIKATPRKSLPNDHLMIQLGTTSWSGKPDSINTGGLPRTFNAYVMLDFPFKTNPKLSVAIGPGIATDNMYFKNTIIGIKDPTTTIRFRNVADTTHFKKYKLSTAFLEAPVELRFSSNPEDNGKSIKVAIGAKVGTLLSAWTKGSGQENSAGNLINTAIVKEKSKQFFNTTRLSLTGRIGVGHFSLFGSYAITPLFREGFGPKVQPVSIGLTLSGL
jgi:hypothetical protein